MPWLAERARQQLEQIASSGRTRQRAQIHRRDGLWASLADGQRLRVFCSNDYLGLAADPRLQEAARAAAGRLGGGSTASQHICGYHQEQAALEEELADALGVERALVGGSGYALNTGALPVLAGPGVGLYSDSLNHASLIDGCRLSRARVQRFAHADMADLQALLEQSPDDQSLIVSDALFSMDGDFAPIRALDALACRSGAALYLDDAHGFGWAGEGRGSVQAAGGLRAEAVQMVTFGKALGGYGAALAGSRDLIEWLLQAGRTTMFATALPPALCATTRAALNICLQEPEHRQRLQANIRHWRAQALAAGLELLPSHSPIQALVLGGESRALSWQQALRARGFWVNAIRPPTVPQGTARLRITLTAAQQTADVDDLVAALAEIAAQEAH